MNRKPKYLQAEHGGRERWLVSYTDVVTILLILFIAIAAQSLKARVEPPPIRVDPPTNLHRAEEKLRGLGLDLKLESRGLIMSLPQAILFQSGDDRVSPSARPVISQIASVLVEVNNKVALVGHADAVPIHNQRFKNNWELSAARSLSLLSLLTTEYGIPESRLSIQTFATSNPKDSNHTKKALPQNHPAHTLFFNYLTPSYPP